jgi:CheY-like chemotaxis protein
MSSLCQRLSGEGELITFSDTEPIQALQAILEQRPRLIVLERLFAATPRGAALINRIKTDPHLGQSDVRVMSHTGDYMRQVARAAAAAAPVTAAVEPGGPVLAVASPATPAASQEQPRPLDWQGTRRAQRIRMKTGAEIQLDGNPAAVVDVSIVGAQVLSGTILRPNQKVRVTIPNDDTLIRCRGTIAWARFELPKASAPPVYRAGVEFLDADAAAVDHFTARNKQ